MEVIRKIVETLKPFKELIATAVFLGGMAYAALTYFATAKQLADAQVAIESQLARFQATNQASLNEIKCLNEHNRELLRVQIDEVSLRSLLERNLQKTEQFRGMDSELARVELANLETSRAEHMSRLARLTNTRADILKVLQNGICSQQA